MACRPLVLRRCRVYVAQSNASLHLAEDESTDAERVTVDPHGVYSVHRWMQRALVAHPWRVPTHADAEVVYFNASFTYRHPWRYPAMRDLRREAPVECQVAMNEHTSISTLASTTTASGIPHVTGAAPELFAMGIAQPTNGRRLPGLPACAHFHWMSVVRADASDVIVPHVLASPGWLVDDAAARGSAPALAREVSHLLKPWAEQKLVFFAGHIPHLFISSLRFHVWRQLHTDPRATVVQRTLWLHLHYLACDATDDELRSRPNSSHDECRRQCRALRFDVECEGACASPRFAIETHGRGLAAFRRHCPAYHAANFSAVYRAAGRAVAPTALSLDAYYTAAMRHRFCIVAPGDDPSTRKLSEAVALSAAGGCVALFVVGVTNKGEVDVSGWPYAASVDYCSIGFVIAAATAATRMSSVLDRLATLPESELAARRHCAAQARPAFAFNTSRGPSAADFILGELCAVARGGHTTPVRQRLCPP